MGVFFHIVSELCQGISLAKWLPPTGVSNIPVITETYFNFSFSIAVKHNSFRTDGGFKEAESWVMCWRRHVHK